MPVCSLSTSQTFKCRLTLVLIHANKSRCDLIRIFMTYSGWGNTSWATESGPSPTCLHYCFSCWDKAARKFYWTRLCGMGSNFIKQYMQMEYNLHYFWAIQHLFAGRRAHTRHHEHTMVIILKAFEAIKKCNSFPFHLVHTASAQRDDPINRHFISMLNSNWLTVFS